MRTSIMLLGLFMAACTCGFGEEPKVGDDAPDFTLTAVDSMVVRLKNYRGKYVVLEFCATWSGPCVKEAAVLKALSQDYPAEKFAIVGVFVHDDPKSVARWRKKYEVDWQQCVPSKAASKEIANKYGITEIPSIWLIDPQGKIVATSLRGDGIRNAVNKHLQPK